MIWSSGLLRDARPRMVRKACTVLAIDGAERWPDAAVPDFSSLSMSGLYPAGGGGETSIRAADSIAPLKPNVLENQPALLASEQAHRRARRPSPLGRASRVEDLKAALLLVEGEVAVSEDDGGGPWEAAAQAREPALRRSGVVDDPDDLPTEFDFEDRRQRAPQRRLVDVSVDSVHDRAEGFELFQR